MKLVFSVPQRSDQQGDVRLGSEHLMPRRQEQFHGLTAGVLDVFVRHRAHHGQPHGDPREAHGGQREVTAVVRHGAYDDAAEQVSEEPAEQ